MKLLEVSKGIPHIEDLPVVEIIETLTNFSNFEITEKVDGAEILFGIDEIGFYTSREAKGGIRIYNEADYGITFASTYMRSAHKLLEQMLPVLRSAGLRPGDQAEAEVLYGQMPNVVPYSADTNYLIFLRTTEGTVNIDRLQQKLDGQAVSVSLVSPFTDDGKSIMLREDINNWKFARVPIIENNVPNTRCYDIKKFLSSIDLFTGQTNLVVLETPLNKIPNWVLPGTWKETKEYIKEHRNLIQATLEEQYILPLKEALLIRLVRDTPSSFGPPVSEGGWIEGVVLKHNVTGKMIKLVDKDVFGTIREIAWQKRNALTEHAKGINSDTSFMGKIYLDMATAIGHPELGTIQAKNYLRKAGSINEERLNTLSEDIDFGSVKSYWLSLLEVRERDLEVMLDKYRKESNVLLKEGRILTQAVRKRTFETFAMSFKKISEFKNLTEQAKSVTDLFLVLVGKQLGEI
jgi:hypothetical protein